MLTGFPKQEAKEGRQPCDLLLWSGQEQFQQDSEAAPGTPTRLLPPFLWSIKSTTPLGSITRCHQVCCGYHNPSLGDGCGNLPGEKCFYPTTMSKGHGNQTW